MDDGLLGFLVFLGIMIASVVYNKRKLAMEEAAEEKGEPAPTPRSIIKDLTKLHKKTAAKPAPKQPARKQYQPSTDFIGRSNYQKNELKVTEDKSEGRSAYAFDSLDEVKKAFIWSEILKRKY